MTTFIDMNRNISWIKSAKRDFMKFPKQVQLQMGRALHIAALGQMADICRPMKGLGPGVLEVRVSHRTNAFRTIYAVKLGKDIYVIHAFQKKSSAGIKTPKKEIDLIKSRIKRLKEEL